MKGNERADHLNSYLPIHHFVLAFPEGLKGGRKKGRVVARERRQASNKFTQESLSTTWMYAGWLKGRITHAEIITSPPCSIS